jgi:Holliday junction resolvase RusA-like endonuclease
VIEPIFIRLAGAPIPKGRPRFSRNGQHVYKDARTADYEEALGWAAKIAMGSQAPFSGAVEVVINAFFEPPKSWSAKKRALAVNGEIEHTSKPDYDNVSKEVTDAMNKIVYKDDSQIVKATVVKMYAEEPRVEIEVYPL